MYNQMVLVIQWRYAGNKCINI